MKSFLFCVLFMGIIFAQTTARLDKEDSANIKRILREVLGEEAVPDENEEEYDGREDEPVSKIDWDDGEDPIRKILRAVYGENEYPVERVEAESQDGRKGEEENLQPEKNHETVPATKSTGKEENPQPEQKPDTHLPAKSKGTRKPKPKQKPETHPATKLETNSPPLSQITTTPSLPAKSKGTRKPKPKQKPETHPATKLETNSPPLSQTTTTPSSSSSGPNQAITPSNQYTLPDDAIKKQVIGSFKKPFNKMWYGANYEVHFIRGSPEGDQLWWRKGDDKVYMRKSPIGILSQEWVFGGKWPKVNLEFRKFTDGSKKQIWNFHDTKLDFSNTYYMPMVRKWMNDKKDESSIKKYADAIQSWCKENDFFFGKNNCVLFSLKDLIDN